MSQHLDSMPSRSEVSALSGNIADLTPKRFPFAKIIDLDEARTQMGLGTNVASYFCRFENATNAPTTGAGFLIGYGYTTTSECQLAMVSKNNEIYIRNKYSGTWSSWLPLATKIANQIVRVRTASPVVKNGGTGEIVFPDKGDLFENTEIVNVFVNISGGRQYGEQYVTYVTETVDNVSKVIVTNKTSVDRYITATFIRF